MMLPLITASLSTFSLRMWSASLTSGTMTGIQWFAQRVTHCQFVYEQRRQGRLSGNWRHQHYWLLLTDAVKKLRVHSFMYVTGWIVCVLVPATVYNIKNVTQSEGLTTTLVCLSWGDPAPEMTYRKEGHTEDYVMGSNVIFLLQNISPIFRLHLQGSQLSWNSWNFKIVLKLSWNQKLSWNFSHLVRMSLYWPLLCRSYSIAFILYLVTS